MAIKTEEKNILRELAKRYSEIASREEQTERKNRMRSTNDLKPVRPAVLIDEIPWFELDIDGKLQCRCEDGFARGMEWYFRSALFRDEYFPCDTIFEKLYPIHKSFSSTGNGLQNSEDQRVTDKRNNIISHSYHDMLADEYALEKMHMPTLTAYPENDRINIETARDILGDILPVVLRGHDIYYVPWDHIPRYRGVEPILLDMYDRPEFLHKIIQKFTDEGKTYYDQMESLGLLETQNPLIHCTPSYITGVPSEGHKDGTPYKFADVWFRTMAQMFNTISPDMHWEFDLQYSLPLMSRCAYTYYGCCEPLDNKLDILRKIPNLRKIGCSPWANVNKMAEIIGGNYVLARKPNPANVAIKTDPEVIRAEIRETLDACIKNGTPTEFVLKDISTVGGNPYNLVVWEKTVKETIDEYYK